MVLKTIFTRTTHQMKGHVLFQEKMMAIQWKYIYDVCKYSSSPETVVFLRWRDSNLFKNERPYPLKGEMIMIYTVRIHRRLLAISLDVLSQFPSNLAQNILGQRELRSVLTKVLHRFPKGDNREIVKIYWWHILMTFKNFLQNHWIFLNQVSFGKEFKFVQMKNNTPK